MFQLKVYSVRGSSLGFRIQGDEFRVVTLFRAPLLKDDVCQRASRKCSSSPLFRPLKLQIQIKALNAHELQSKLLKGGYIGEYSKGFQGWTTSPLKVP